MNAAATSDTPESFTAEERAAMKERAKELRTQSKRSKSKADAEADMLAKIAELAEPDRDLAERLHTLVTEAAPGLTAKPWYGMPGWAKDGKVLCFFQPADKFKTRYATFGFNEEAALDECSMWPTAFALTELTPDAEARLAELVRRAAG